MRHFERGRGTGWLVTREWFINEVINGTQLTLRTHVAIAAKKRKARKPGSRTPEETDEELADLPVNCSRNPTGADDICCGEHKPGNVGLPIVLACQLCPASPTYWRSG
jgi:hypothetical protein